MCNLAYISAISQAGLGFTCNWILSQMVGLNCIWFRLTTNRTAERDLGRENEIAELQTLREKMFIILKFLDIKWLWSGAHTCGVCFTVYNKCRNNERYMCYMAIVKSTLSHVILDTLCQISNESVATSFGFQFSIFEQNFNDSITISRWTSQACLLFEFLYLR